MATAWVVAPLLAHSFSGPTALPRALILSLGAGLVWQAVLVLITVKREQGSLRWPVLKAALWLNGPIDTRTGRRNNKLWWMVIPLMVLLALEEMLPSLPTPGSRDTATFFGSVAGQDWMSGNWLWFAILIVQFGVLFACYHLHEPWVIPQTLLVDTFALSLPARRWRSSLISIAVHSGQTVFFFFIALGLVLR